MSNNVDFMVFNATSNYISVTSWRSDNVRYIYIGIYVNLTSSLDGKKKMKLMKWHIRYDRIDGIMICQWLMATELYVRYIEDVTKFTVEQELLTL